MEKMSTRGRRRPIVPVQRGLITTAREGGGTKRVVKKEEEEEEVVGNHDCANALRTMGDGCMYDGYATHARTPPPRASTTYMMLSTILPSAQAGGWAHAVGAITVISHTAASTARAAADRRGIERERERERERKRERERERERE
jgi:hypothetical protein